MLHLKSSLRRRRCVTLLALVLLASAFAASVKVGATVPAVQQPALTGTTTQLTPNPAAQLDPSISGNIMVWTDQRDGNDEIYYCNVTNCAATERRVTTSLEPQRLHDVSGNIIVYSDLSPPAPTVRAFDISTNTDLGVISPTESQHPRIDGPMVVYEVGSVGATRIGLTNLVTGARTLIATTAVEAAPVVNHDPVTGVTRVVYERRATPSELSDIVVHDLTTGSETVIASGPSDQRRPDIDGDIVVYDQAITQESNANDRDIFIYNLATGATTQLSRPGAQVRPHVSGDFVTFDDLSAGNDVMLYHIPSGTFHPVATGASTDFLTDISGNRVVYTSNQAGNFDIWMYAFDLAAEIAVDPLRHPYGEVVIGSPATKIVTISNVGGLPLSVTAIKFSVGSSPAFTKTLDITLPHIIAPGATINVPVTYAPTAIGFDEATLFVASNDLDEGMVQVGFSGFGVSIAIQQAGELLAFFDASVEEGTLAGRGSGSLAQLRLGLMRRAIVLAGQAIASGRTSDACELLRVAQLLSDGLPEPPDLVVGDARTELNQRIQNLRTSLGCP